MIKYRLRLIDNNTETVIGTKETLLEILKYFDNGITMDIFENGTWRNLNGIEFFKLLLEYDEVCQK